MSQILSPASADIGIGGELHALAQRLYPLFRSTTGQGVRETLAVLTELVPLDVKEVRTGTPVFDWQVPEEWVFCDAHVQDETGHKVIDVAASNLHVVNGSVGVDATMSWQDLRPHLHSIPEHPDWIPYRTAYFAKTWGFCLTHRQFLELERRGNHEYRVRIDAAHVDGALTYGEVVLPGATDDEVLISTHICHPSLANDNLSGIAVATYLARHLQGIERRYTYRFVFVPATIGAITWLSVNEPHLERIKHGLVLSLLGDSGPVTYKLSRQGHAEIDCAVHRVLADRGAPFSIREFSPFGYDERQYCSPAFDLPVGCFMRTPHGEFPEYHSSADNLDFVEPRYLEESFTLLASTMSVLEQNRVYVSQKPKCEPRLGPLGLYSAYGTPASKKQMQQAVLWTLNLSDGRHALLDIAERSMLPFAAIADAAAALVAHGLLRVGQNDDGKNAMVGDTTLIPQRSRECRSLRMG